MEGLVDRGVLTAVAHDLFNYENALGSILAEASARSDSDDLHEQDTVEPLRRVQEKMWDSRVRRRVQEG